MNNTNTAAARIVTAADAAVAAELVDPGMGDAWSHLVDSWHGR